MLGYRALSILHIGAQIAVVEIDIDVVHQLTVLGAHHRRPPCAGNPGHLAQRDCPARRQRDQRVRRDGIGIAAHVARIAQHHAVTLPSLHRGGDRLGADGVRDGGQNVVH